MITATAPVDFQHIVGHDHAKRVLEVAAAGGHPILLSGPPGGGKSLLARALVSILPPLNTNEAREVTDMYDASGYLVSADAPCRPLVAPHYTTPLAGLIGGGGQRIGLLALAHHGVLVLDDLPAFGSKLAVVAEALEQRQVVRHDAHGIHVLPAAFLLVATQRPCLCGWWLSGDPACTCTPTQLTRYQQRVPNALRDRIAIHCEVPALSYEQLASGRVSEPSAVVRERVTAARQQQAERFAQRPNLNTNGQLGSDEVRLFCLLNDSARSVIQAATRQLNLTARAYHQTLTVARTIADLAGNGQIGAAHVAESLQYRRRW
jgi:magnesium chelatase family protein